MDRFETIRELIAANSALARFGDFGDGVQEEWINKAEAALPSSLPESYKWWLRDYGGGEIGGEEIFSVCEEDFDSIVGGDIVSMYRLSQQEPNAREDRIPICHSDVDGVFSFDASSGLHDGEYPILAEATGTYYARDFLEFLGKRIEAFQ